MAIITGTAGDDTLTSGDNSDVLEGLAGDDTLFGGLGNDRLLGGDGDDVLDGGAGEDRLDGGDGDDILVVASDGVDDVYEGGDGVDTLDLSRRFGALDAVFVDLQALIGDRGIVSSAFTGRSIVIGVENVIGVDGDRSNVLLGNASANRLVGGLAADALDGRAGDDLLLGGAGNDEILGGAGNDNLDGGDGDDRLDGGGGADLMTGGRGDDILIADAPSDRFSGGFGVDTLFAAFSVFLADDIEHVDASAGNTVRIKGNASGNEITGTTGADVLIGLDGNDILNGGAGADRMVGGSGNDTFFVDHVSDSIHDSSGFDTVIGNIDFTLNGSLEAFREQGAQALAIRGTGLNNVITMNGGDDVVRGGGGNDRIIGGAGDDVLLGHDGDDELSGFNGDDFLFGGPGQDLLRPNNGEDTVLMTDQDTALIGDRFSDTIILNLASGSSVVAGFNTSTVLSGLDILDVRAFDFADFAAFTDAFSSSTVFGFAGVAVTFGVNGGNSFRLADLLPENVLL